MPCNCFPGATRAVDLHDSFWWENWSWCWVWSCATQIAYTAGVLKNWSALWRLWRHAKYLYEGRYESSLDGRPSAFSDSSLRTVCLFLFVDCSSWPNLTAACAAQVAKRFRNRGLVTIFVHLYLYKSYTYTSQLFQKNKIPASFLCQNSRS